MTDHIHRYKKVDLSRDKDKPYPVYKCVKPICSHYIPTELAEGKLCECNKCGEPMVITKVTLRGNGGKPMTRPHCLQCIKRKKVVDVDTISEFLSGTKA